MALKDILAEEPEITEGTANRPEPRRTKKQSSLARRRNKRKPRAEKLLSGNSARGIKFTILGFDQVKAYELGLNIKHLAILRWFMDFREGGGMKKLVVGNCEFCWVSPAYVVAQLPILDIRSRKVVGRYFSDLVGAGLLFRHIAKSERTGTNMTYYRITKRVRELEFRRQAKTE